MTTWPGSPTSVSTDDAFTSLIAGFGPALCYWHAFHTSGKRIDTAGSDDESIAAHFLRNLLQTDRISPDKVQTVDLSLILYAVSGAAPAAPATGRLTGVSAGTRIRRQHVRVPCHD